MACYRALTWSLNYHASPSPSPSPFPLPLPPSLCSQGYRHWRRARRCCSQSWPQPSPMWPRPIPRPTHTEWQPSRWVQSRPHSPMSHTGRCRNGNQLLLQLEVELQAAKEELRREREGHSETRQRLATAEKVRGWHGQSKKKK